MTDVDHEWCLLVVILTLAALLTGAGVLFVWLPAPTPRGDRRRGQRVSRAAVSEGELRQ